MVDGSPNDSIVLSYASRSVPPRRWWVLLMFPGLFAFGQLLQPRIMPPGWPGKLDLAAIGLIPVGAVVMALTTSLSARVISLYGAISVCVLVPGWLSDSRLKFALDSNQTIYVVLFNWCAAVCLAWLFCRLAASLCRQSFHRPGLSTDETEKDVTHE